MTNILWDSMQYISDKWIIKADEDAVRKHFQGEKQCREGDGGTLSGLPPKPVLRRTALSTFRWMPVAACICLCLCAAILVHHLNNSMNTPPKMESLVMEVTSLAEMKEFLGYAVPVLENKEAVAYTLRTSGEYAEIGSILYSDGSSFQITQSDSGLLGDGGQVESISGVSVHFGWEDGHQYAAWTYNGYSCCYYDYDAGGTTNFPNSGIDEEIDYKNEIRSLILQLK